MTEKPTIQPAYDERRTFNGKTYRLYKRLFKEKDVKEYKDRCKELGYKVRAIKRVKYIPVDPTFGKKHFHGNLVHWDMYVRKTP